MTSVFISYSRTDRDFVTLLRSELERTKHDAWVDLEDIPPSADWQREIFAGIDGADTFVCVLSPEWLASQTCQTELARAVLDHKRMVPLVRHDVHGLDIPPPVRAANWIFFRPSDDGDAAFRHLLFALDTDLDYWHLASRMQVRAGQWEQSHENSSFTLRGAELSEAERWLAQGADKQPSPTALQTRYITASRRASARRQRTIITTLSAFLAVAVILATLASIQTVRVGQQNTQLSNDNTRLFARALAGASSADLVNQQIGQALLLADAATQRQDTVETRNALLDTLEASSHLAATVTDVVTAGTSNGGASGVSFSADGKTLMYADLGQEGEITLWDTTTRRARVRYSVGDTIYGAVMSPDGALVATLGIDNGLILRHATTGEQIAQLALGTSQEPDGSYNIINLDLDGTKIAFSSDGSRLAAVLCDSVACAHPSIGVWNGRTGAAEGRLSLSFIPVLTSLTFSPDGRSIAATECNIFAKQQVCQIELWDLSGPTPALRFQRVITPADGAPYDVEAVAFSPDGTRLYSGGCPTVNCAGEGRILTWDPTSGTRSPNTAPIATPGGVIGKMAFSPDGRTFVTADVLKNVLLWDARTNRPIGAALVGHTAEVAALAFSPDGSTFATAGLDGKVLLWRVGPFTPFSLPVGPDLDASSQVAFSPDGKLLATASCDGVVRLWDTATHKVSARLSVPDVGAFCLRALAFSPNSQLLATRLDDGATIIWDVTSDTFAAFCNDCGITLDLASEPPAQVAFSPDSQLIAVPVQNAEGSQVALANTTTGQLYHTFTGPGASSVHGAAFSPDGKLLAVGGGGKDTSGITLWDLAQQKTVAVLTVKGSNAEVGALAFTHDGRHLLALDGNSVLTVWDVASRKVIGSLDLHNSIPGEQSLSLHPDGPYGWLLAAAANQTIWLIDLHDLTHPQLYVHAITEPSYIHNVAFSPDGKLLAASEDDFGVVVRLATLDEWQQQACALANRNFSHAEWDQYFAPQGLAYTPICPGLPIPG